MSAISLDMGGAFWNLTDPIAFKVVSTAAVDFEAVETLENQIVFDGFLQPMQPRELMVKPEGERRWKWLTLFTEQVLQPAAILQDEEGANYRVMKLSDWNKLASYGMYQIIQAPFPPFAGS
jgi:hypothetical protein